MSKKPSNSQPNPQRPGSTEKKTAPSDDRPQGVIATIREWGDALVIAYLLAMFIRMFVFELFKIPSSSMTPTLLGTERPRHGYIDADGDGQEDMILRDYGGAYDVYLKKDGRYHYAGKEFKTDEVGRIWSKKLKIRQDRIIVCKFLYWFTAPKRGDIVVFKVPEKIYQREKPIYIKRVVGLPGEILSFDRAPGVPGHQDTMGHLVVDGKRVESPDFFKDQLYEYRNMRGISELTRPADGIYANGEIVKLCVPENGVYVFGDNTVSSTDGRYWGQVDLDRLRGRAIFRYNPEYFPYTKKPGFLN